VIIYSMTATFGKLEHETLTLKPGLNIVEAPNEWGKSTWCAFLVNMLYGIDTRARSSATVLADKERYAPWSGSPMSGRIDLNWNGRDITIERRTKGRLIFGDFHAYETATGMEIPELTGANCGQTLLGVERGVFTRSGFLKFSDLPVTQDDALRRRLNNLVTTGDESGAGDQLAQKLKDLKNKCRHNRTGLLPQAEAEQQQLRNQLESLRSLKTQTESIRRRQTELEDHISKLENHKKALRCAVVEEDNRQVALAVIRRDEAAARQKMLFEQCLRLPSEQEAEQALHSTRALQEKWQALELEMKTLPPAPVPPDTPDRYQQMEPDAVCSNARQDLDNLASLQNRQKKYTRIRNAACGIGLAGLVLAVLLFVLKLVSPAIFIGICAGAAAAVIAAVLLCSKQISGTVARISQLSVRHAPLLPEFWLSDAEQFAAQHRQYQTALAGYQAVCADLENRRQALLEEIQASAGGDLSDSAAKWEGVLSMWAALTDANREQKRLDDHAKALQSMIKPVQPPDFPDTLQLSEAETLSQLENARFEQRQLHLKLGQCMGQSESLGQESLLKARLDTLNRRIARLEDTYNALDMALDALHEATANLQRRFAPRIAQRTQAIFSKLTGGRYQRITLGQDLSLSACAQDEDTLRTAQWRSDGTADQLYLALRLAVAEELTPEAPLILDDALVRFDDCRLASALEILKEEALTKQVILFTCQNREKALCQPS